MPEEKQWMLYLVTVEFTFFTDNSSTVIYRVTSTLWSTSVC